jgi:hypothetical protein
LHPVGICNRLGLLTHLRLSAEGYSLAELIHQTRTAFAAGTRLLMLTYHSSSLLPGATARLRMYALRPIDGPSLRHSMATCDYFWRSSAVERIL